jgi:adenylate cyclase
VLFADLRGFTARSESITPQEASVVLRLFYTVAEEVLFPKAMIDKLIGDEVMAPYLPIYVAGCSKASVMEAPTARCWSSA